jgi:uncharacterized protein
MESYLTLSNQGKNDWWRYLLSVISILFIWQIIGSIPYGLFFIWEYLQFPNTEVTIPFIQSNFPLVNFTLLMLGAACLVGGMILAIRFIHMRKIKSLITPNSNISWKRVFLGLGGWLLLSGLFSLVESLLHPGRYVLTFNSSLFLPFIFLALILVPIQTTGEELFFRAYLLQGFGRKIKNIWWLCVLSGIFFMIPHFLNPEASLNFGLMGLYYFSMGAFLAFITLFDGGLELALGVHAANNLFSLIFANSTVTVIPTPSLFTVNGLDVIYSLIAELVGIMLFILVLLIERKHKVSSNLPTTK